MNKTGILKTIVILIIMLLLSTTSLLIIQIIHENKDTEGVEVEELQNIIELSKKTAYECNELKYTVIDIDSLILNYYNNYNYYLFKYPEKSYELLDKDYREKRFGDLNSFIEYVERNKDIIISNTIESYKTEANDETITYICKEKNGNYFIINEKEVMDYTVILDAYTIDLPEFIETYNSASDQEKAILNINKFEQALNAKDYKYAYNCLSEGFKDNYFITLEDFENYINQNWYNGDFEVEYGKFEEDSGLYKYTISITNKENTEQSFEKTIIMKLSEGTAFEMSFNV